MPGPVSTAYASATTFFQTYSPSQVANMKERHREATELAKILDDYNNGITGPGHWD